MLQSVVDPTAGGLCWLPVDGDTAGQDTTAMSLMTSMLHDADRNRKYESAITNAVQAFIRTHDRPPVVLDIGCGTGLLSMLAARAGAEEVYGCELYKPLAQIAREVTELNCKGKVKIIGKRSTDLEVGEGEDLPRRADMCVNEIYDSALLGEGCLPAFRHALANLLVDKPVMVPAGAEVHGVLLTSPSLRARHDLSRAEFSQGVPIARNARAAKCKGGRKAWPLQGAEVEDGVKLSESFHALTFKFGEPFPEEGCRSRRVTVKADRDGILDAVMMTWDLNLDGEVSYSTRPDQENWQDHWCPAYFPLVGAMEVEKGDTVRLKVTHSELHVMFEVLGVDRHASATPSKSTLKRGRSPDDPNGCSGPLPPSCAKGSRTGAPVDADGYRMEREWDPEPCGCGWHVLCNPERIGMLTDEARREVYRLAVGRLLRGLPPGCRESAVCLNIGEGGVCAFLAAGEGASAVVSYEPEEWSQLLVGQVIRNNDLEEKIHILETAEEWPFLKEAVAPEADGAVGGEEQQERPQERLLCDSLMGDPFYYRMQSLVLYQAINFWYLRRLLHPVLKPEVRVLPMRAIVCVAGIELPDLSLNHGTVGSVLGFDHSPYDERIRSRWHQLLYPYPLRAYRHRLLTEVRDLLSFDYVSLPTDVESSITLSSTAPGILHAVAIWVDYQLDESARWSTFGSTCLTGEGIERSMIQGSAHEKQMLKFLPRPEKVAAAADEQGEKGVALKVSGRFDADGGRMTFDVSVI
ncbi:unnamed protein product [Sphacelaria rigidula]